jgi:hypothetical protein
MRRARGQPALSFEACKNIDAIWISCASAAFRNGDESHARIAREFMQFKAR